MSVSKLSSIKKSNTNYNAPLENISLDYAAEGDIL